MTQRLAQSCGAISFDPPLRLTGQSAKCSRFHKRLLYHNEANVTFTTAFDVSTIPISIAKNRNAKASEVLIDGNDICVTKMKQIIHKEAIMKRHAVHNYTLEECRLDGDCPLRGLGRITELDKAALSAASILVKQSRDSGKINRTNKLTMATLLTLFLRELVQTSGPVPRLPNIGGDMRAQIYV
ncbi:hypothetical protein Tco_0578488 [Tanacetum coccineum]